VYAGAALAFTVVVNRHEFRTKAQVKLSIGLNDRQLGQESPANAKVSARQPWYIRHNSLFTFRAYYYKCVCVCG